MATRVERPIQGEPLRIREAALSVGRSPGTIRLWERQGLLSPSRSSGGWRQYDAGTMTRLRRIARLRTEHLNAPAIQRLLGTDGSAPTAAQPQPQLGPRLRALRKLRGLTLAHAAAGAGISVSFLGALEKNHTGVADTTIKRVLAFYETSLAALRPPRAQGPLLLTRAGDRRSVAGRFPGVQVEQLISGPASMEPQVFFIEPGAGSDRGYSHEGEEFIFVQKGQFEVRLEGLRPYRLREGDCLYYASTTEHSWHNPGKVPTTLFWVNTPPTFFARWATEAVALPPSVRPRSSRIRRRREAAS